MTILSPGPGFPTPLSTPDTLHGSCLSLLAKDDEEVLELRRKAVKAKAESERNDRRSAAAEKKERAEKRRGLEAIEKRGIAVKGWIRIN